MLGQLNATLEEENKALVEQVNKLVEQVNMNTDINNEILDLTVTDQHKDSSYYILYVSYNYRWESLQDDLSPLAQAFGYHQINHFVIKTEINCTLQ